MPIIDERIKDTISLDLSGDTWKLRSVQWKDPDESHGLQHVYIRVYNEDNERLRPSSGARRLTSDTPRASRSKSGAT